MLNRRTLVSGLGLSALGACDRASRGYEPRFEPSGSPTKSELTFGVYPVLNPQGLDAAYQPLIGYLNQKLDGPQLHLVASRNYAQFGERLRRGEFDIALANPLQTLEAARHGFSVFAKAADDCQFRGLIVVRKDAGLDDLRKLRSKVISYPAPTALAGALMPQHFLQTHGVPVDQTVTRYVGSHEAALLSVVLGTADAAATWPPSWEAFSRAYPHYAVQMVVGWQTQSLVNNSMVARESVPAEVVQKLEAALVGLSWVIEGRHLLPLIGASGFMSANITAYHPVRAFLEDYERLFGARQGVPQVAP